MTFLVQLGAWLFLSAFFSGIETGLYSVSHVRLGRRISDGKDTRAAWLHRLISRPTTAIMAVLIGTNVSVYMATASATQLMLEGMGETLKTIVPLVTTLVMTPVIFVLSELVPKQMFRRHAESLTYAGARPMCLFMFAVYPLITAVKVFLLPLRLLLGSGTERSWLYMSRSRMLGMVAAGREKGVVEDYQVEMVKKALRFRHVPVRDVMVPWDDVSMVDADASIETLLGIARNRRHSRMPVFRRITTEIVGVVNIFEVLYHPDRGETVGDYIEEAVFVKEDESILSVMRSLQGACRVMAVVLGGDGKPAGIVTVKDLVEEISGELSDW